MTKRMAVEKAARTCKSLVKAGCAVVEVESGDYDVCIVYAENLGNLHGVIGWLPAGQSTIAGGVIQLCNQIRLGGVV